MAAELLSEPRIAWVSQKFAVDAPDPRFHAMWTAQREDWFDLDARSYQEALIWARERAPLVTIRLRIPPRQLVTFSAGDASFQSQWPGDERDWEEPPRWPCPLPPTGRRVDEYGGAVHVFEHDRGFVRLPEYTVAVQQEREPFDALVLLERRDFPSFRPALDWAREQASVVILRTGEPGSFEYDSRGEREPPEHLWEGRRRRV